MLFIKIVSYAVQQSVVCRLAESHNYAASATLVSNFLPQSQTVPDISNIGIGSSFEVIKKYITVDTEKKYLRSSVTSKSLV